MLVYVLLQPHSPDNRALARECKDVKIDRVYVGSCTGGKTEDFLAVAKVFQASVRSNFFVTYLYCYCLLDDPMILCRHKLSTDFSLKK